MDDLTLQDVFVATDTHPSRVIHEETILVKADAREVLHLNESATWYLSQLDGERSLAAILEAAIERYEVEEDRAWEDLRELVRRWSADGIVQRV